MALWLQNFVNTELKEEEQNIPKRIKSSSSVFMPSVIANGAKLGVAAVARAPNLFSMCTTGFKPCLAPLDTYIPTN